MVTYLVMIVWLATVCTAIVQRVARLSISVIWFCKLVLRFMDMAKVWWRAVRVITVTKVV